MIKLLTLLAAGAMMLAATSANACGCDGDTAGVQAAQATQCPADTARTGEPAAVQCGQGCGMQGGSHEGHHGNDPQGAPPAEVQIDKNGVQKATIVVDNGFRPGILNVKVGQPVELTFDTKNRGCATSIVFEGLDIKKDLTNGKKTVVKFTPKKPGTYTYACPMKMLKGTIVVK